MSQFQAACFRVLLVALLTVLALIVASPVSQRELEPRLTPATVVTWYSGSGDLVEVRP